MYEEHPDFTPPPKQALLWRYLSFTKFVSLLDKSALYFASADRLADPFEGSYSELNVAMRPILYRDPEIAQKIGAAMQTLKEYRRFFFINCWHENKYESEAMWRLYSGEREGIAIRTTFDLLRESLQGEIPVQIGRVNYVDYATTPIPEGNVLSAYLHKRKSFEHEAEVRAISMRMPERQISRDELQRPADSGLYIPVDLARLLEEVVVAPYADEWFVQLVTSVAARYDCEAPIRRSSLAESPVWG